MNYHDTLDMKTEGEKNVQYRLNFEPNGTALRDQGIKQVSDNNKIWMENCITRIRYAFDGWDTFKEPFTGEDIRFYLVTYKGLRPTHQNAWGALTKALIARKLIVKTGNYVMPKDSSSHGRMIQEYRRAS